MKINQINNTNFKAQLWPKTKLVNFEQEQLLKDFAKKTTKYPNLILEQSSVPFMRDGKDVFKLYDDRMRELYTDTYECYSKYTVRERLLNRYIEIFNSMVKNAKRAGYKI